MIHAIKVRNDYIFISSFTKLYTIYVREENNIVFYYKWWEIILKYRTAWVSRSITVLRNSISYNYRNYRMKTSIIAMAWMKIYELFLLPIYLIKFFLHYFWLSYTKNIYIYTYIYISMHINWIFFIRI